MNNFPNWVLAIIYKVYPSLKGKEPEVLAEETRLQELREALATLIMDSAEAAIVRVSNKNIELEEVNRIVCERLEEAINRFKEFPDPKRLLQDIRDTTIDIKPDLCKYHYYKNSCEAAFTEAEKWAKALGLSDCYSSISDFTPIIEKVGHTLKQKTAVIAQQRFEIESLREHIKTLEAKRQEQERKLSLIEKFKDLARTVSVKAWPYTTTSHPLDTFPLQFATDLRNAIKALTNHDENNQ